MHLYVDVVIYINKALIYILINYLFILAIDRKKYFLSYTHDTGL